MNEVKERLVYKVSDIMQLLGIGNQKAYMLVHREDFPKIVLEKRILIPKEAFHKWLNEQVCKEITF
jgi:predicted DNA-binding transcriptional regulator AlpA